MLHRPARRNDGVFPPFLWRSPPPKMKSAKIVPATAAQSWLFPKISANPLFTLVEKRRFYRPKLPALRAEVDGRTQKSVRPFSCYNSSIGKTRIKMQTFRIIAKNPSHENAASKLVPAAVRFFVLAKFVRSKQHSALLYETAVLLFFAVINARMRDDIISSCRQRFSSFLLAALVRSKQRGTSLL